MDRSTKPPAAPCRVLIVKGLAETVDEETLGDLIKPYTPVENIRVIRKSGKSRGFAFVEFSTIDQAKNLLELLEGSLVIGGVTATVDFSLSGDQSSSRIPGDWQCMSCQCANFAKRMICFSCGLPRPANVATANVTPLQYQKNYHNYPHSHPFIHPQHHHHHQGPRKQPSTILYLSDLDQTVNEDSVRAAFAPSAISIKGIRLPRDKSGSNRGFAFVEFHSIPDASAALDLCIGMQINRLPVVASFATATTDRQSYPVLPHGFFPDPNSPGIYYNPITRYYYELSTERYYYFNIDCQAFYTYNSITATYEPFYPAGTYPPPPPPPPSQPVPAPSVETTTATPTNNDAKKKPSIAISSPAALNTPPRAKEDRAMPTIEAVAADPSKPVKFSLSTTTLSTTASTSTQQATPPPSKGSWFASNDEDDQPEEGMAAQRYHHKSVTASSAALHSVPKQTKYHGASTPNTDSSEASPLSAEDRLKDADLIPASTKSICFLCKRQFPSAEALDKHERLSDLHRQNLETQRQKEEMRAQDRRAIDERNREARLEPQRQRPNETGPMGEENLGYRMMKTAGWSDGAGLGREGQGRTSAIQVNVRVERAGLGSIDESPPDRFSISGNDSYKDAVRKRAMQRFEQMSGTDLESVWQNSPFLRNDDQNKRPKR